MAADFSFDKDLMRIDALAAALQRELPAHAREPLGRYVALVATWNRKLDLTAARDAAAQVEVLLADALVLAELELVGRDSRVVDVGSGAGSPCLPLLLLRPDLRAVLVEPLRKRVAFLRTAIGSLDLVGRAQVLEAKLNVEAPQVSFGPFDVAMSRATFAPEVWVRAGSQLAPRVLLLLAAAQAPAAPAGSARGQATHYRLPSHGAERSVVVYAREPANAL
ncbi:MAG TPA: RsmG family class I SAM-dependent methyltransferase [Polyangiales bacterium]